MKENPFTSDEPSETLALDRSLRRLALRLVSNETTADDVVQDAWVAAADRLAAPVRNRDAWMRKVVRNLANRSIARKVRRRDVEALAARESVIDSEVDDVELAAMNELLRGTLAELREPYRTVLRMRFLDERSVESIAAELGRTRDTVKSQVRRGTSEMRDALDRASGGDRTSWAGALAALLGPGIERARPAVPAPRMASRTLVNGAFVAAACIAPLVLWQTGLLGGSRAGATEEAAAGPVDDSSARVTPSEAADPTEPSPALASAAPAPPRSPASAGVREAPAPLAGQEPTRTLDVTLLRVDGTPAIDGVVELIGTTDAFARYPVDGRGRATIEVPEHRLVHGPRIPGTDGGIRVTARERNGAWSDVYQVPLPPQGARLSVQANGPGQTLRGVVVDPDGATVPGARVRLRREVNGQYNTPEGIPHQERGLQTTTDAEGRFEIEGVPLRVHRLEATAVGWCAGARAVHGDGDFVDVTLELVRGLELVGTVRHEDGSVAAGAIVSEMGLGKDFEDGLPHAIAGLDGRFVIHGLSPGTRRFFAWAPDARSRFASTLVELEPGTDARWDAVLVDEEPLRVRVVDAAGDPVRNATAVVVASREGTPPWGVQLTTDEQGRAAFEHLPEEPLGMAVRGSATDTASSVVFDEVRPGPDELLVELPGRRPGTCEVRGVLVDHEGAPFESALVIGCSPGGMFQLQTDVLGAFHAKAQHAGRYEIWAAIEGHGFLYMAKIELGANGDEDLGIVRAPAPIDVRFDWTDVDPERTFTLEVEGACDMGPKGILMLERPKAGHALLPGRYRARASDGGVEPVVFAVETGERPVVRLQR